LALYAHAQVVRRAYPSSTFRVNYIHITTVIPLSELLQFLPEMPLVLA
jgi:hypothetical protein